MIYQGIDEGGRIHHDLMVAAESVPQPKDLGAQLHFNPEYLSRSLYKEMPWSYPTNSSLIDLW